MGLNPLDATSSEELGIMIDTFTELWISQNDSPGEVSDAQVGPGVQKDLDETDSSPHHDGSKEAPEITETFTLRWEPVNVAIIEKALMLVATRCVSMEHYDCFEILMSIRSRAVKVRRGKGVIAVLQREAKALGCLQNRLFSGIQGISTEKLPQAILRELAHGVPPALAGLSVFAFNKCIRYLCRHDLSMCEIDIVNALYSVLCEILDVPQILRDFRDNREQILDAMAEYFRQKSDKQLSRDNVKELFISLGFGGSVWSWMQEHLDEPVELDGKWGDFLQDMEDALQKIRYALADKYPDELKLLKKKGKTNPYASLTFAVYAHHERGVLQKMLSTCGQAAVSPEHDGVGAQGDSDKLLQACAEAVTPLRVAIKEYPSDPFALFRTRFPDFDWNMKSNISIKDYADLLIKCRSYIELGQKAVYANKGTFARLVAAQLDPVTNVPAVEGEKRTHFETFTGYGIWQSKHRDDLTSLTMDILRDLVKPPIRMKWERQGVVPDPPAPLNNITFAASLGDTILGILAEKPPAHQLDGDITRNKVLHSDGYVYHFDAQTLNKAKPADRMAHRLGCTSESWVPPADIADTADGVFQKITDFCRSGSEELMSTDLGKEICDNLDTISGCCSVLKVLRDFAGSWDGVLWMLRSVSRSAGGHGRFCEFLYLYGPGSSGKDVVMLMVLTFFGEQPDNYGCVLNGSFIVDAKGGQVNKEAASPFLAATAGKRFVWASEIPKHNNLQIDLIKQYCEQHGAPMTCRKLFKAPFSFRPIGMIFGTSNYAAVVANKDDDGYHRRARLWQTTQTFKAKPTKLTEHKADDTLKARILAGDFNSQLVWLVRGLWPSLATDVNPGTTLLPIPKFMKELEDLSNTGGSQDKLREWIHTRCKPVERKHATDNKVFKKAAASFLGVTEPEIGPILTAIGIDTKGTVNSNGDRIAYGQHQDWKKDSIPGLLLNSAD